MVDLSATFMAPARESPGMAVRAVAAHITQTTLEPNKSEFCICSPTLFCADERKESNKASAPKTRRFALEA